MKRTLLLVILVFIALGLNAQFAKVGNSGFKFLDISVDARAIAMGETYAALAEGPSAVFWNPAGINLSKGINVFTHYNKWWNDIMHGSFSFTYNLGLAGNLGVFFVGLHSGDIEVTTVENPDGTGGVTSYYAYAAGLTYGRFLTDRFSFAINLKILGENYGTTPNGDACRSLGFGMDVGGLYVTSFRDMKIGLAVMNFGPDITPSGTYPNYENGEVVDDSASFKNIPLPGGFRGGIAMTLYETEMMKVIGAFDVYHPSDNVERYSLGVEAGLMNMVFLRGGYEFGRDDNVLALNTGLGFNIPAGNVKVKVDLAYSYGNYLPSTERVSLKVGF